MQVNFILRDSPLRRFVEWKIAYNSGTTIKRNFPVCKTYLERMSKIVVESIKVAPMLSAFGNFERIKRLYAFECKQRSQKRPLKVKGAGILDNHTINLANSKQNFCSNKLISE